MTVTLSNKTKVLNIFRSVFKITALEKLLLFVISKKAIPSFIKKIVPNSYQYSKGTIRNSQVNGINYKLDISDYLQHSAYFDLETEPYKVLFDLVKPGFKILDVGVNYGHTLLEMASRIGDEGRIYGFEPVPFLYKKALHNISLNNFSNITLINKAISSTAGELYFDSVDNTHNSGGTKMSFDSDSNNKVEAITIDDFFESEKLTGIDLIKADIEGFEMEMLKGATQTLSKYKPMLFLELNNDFLSQAGSSGADMIKFLSELGYKVYNADGFKQLSPTDDFKNTHIDVLAIDPNFHSNFKKLNHQKIDKHI